MIRVAVLTISDSRAAGEGRDISGDAVQEWCAVSGYELTARRIVTDDVGLIATTLTEWCDADTADLVLTTGGTGLSERDYTPEATRAVIEREAQGIAEYLRACGAVKFPRAALSRGLAGTRARTLVVNLPGSPNGVRDALSALDAIVQHACDVLRGNVTSHMPGAEDKDPLPVAAGKRGRK